MKWFKTIINYTLLLIATFYTLLFFSCARSETELIPREVLFNAQTKMFLQISPDAKYVAYLAPLNGVLNINMKTIGENDDRVITNDTRSGIRSYFWTEDSRHIIYLKYLEDDKKWHLFRTNIDTKEVEDFKSFEGKQVYIVKRDKHSLNNLLIAMRKSFYSPYDVYNLDLVSIAFGLVVKNPGYYRDWISDKNLNVRGVLAFTTEPDRINRIEHI